MPSVRRLLETALYVDDLERSALFYKVILQFEPLAIDGPPADGPPRLIPLQIPGGCVLLLFKKGASVEPIALPGGTIPPHDGDGRLHLAFAIKTEDLDPWRERLARLGVEIEGETGWPRGGTSLYFRDPDGHLVELATPGIWPIY